MSFARFMERALYHPQLGYYCSDKEKLGPGGDFFTSCTLTPVFGHTIAAQLSEAWRLSGISDFTIVEYGAGTGELCKAVLEHFSGESNLPGKLRYVIIEISPALREKQRSLLSSGVEWISHISELDGFEGAVISNELLDNFPVHRVVMREQLMEVLVDYDNGFREVEVPAGKALVDYFAQLRVKLPAGFNAEVCLAAKAWLEEICTAMRRGFVFTVDYGYLAGELFSARFAQGTLVSYNRHRVVQDAYSEVGNQDITSHVNFSALALFGQNNGLQLSGFREQGAFLSALGFEKRLIALRRDDGPASALRRENVIMQTLIGDMGKKFKVLAMQKNIPPVKLTGFSTGAGV